MNGEIYPVAKRPPKVLMPIAKCDFTVCDKDAVWALRAYKEEQFLRGNELKTVTNNYCDEHRNRAQELDLKKEGFTVNGRRFN